MPERTVSKAVERSSSLYVRLLRLYPKSHREEYGSAMSQLFRDQCCDAWAASRTRGLLAFWMLTMLDLLKTSILEHLSNLNRRISILKLFRPQFTPLPVFIKVFTAVFLLAFLTSGVIAFLIPKSFRSTVQIMIDENNRSQQEQAVFFNNPRPLETEFAVIRSHRVLSKAIDALNLREAWGKKFNNGVPLSSDRTETVLRRNLEFQGDCTERKTVIGISVISDSPDEAARLANKVADAYRSFRIDEARVEESRANNDGVPKPMKRTVSIIQAAVPGLPFRPSISWIITLGAVAGILLGLIAGGVAAGFVERPKGGANPVGVTRETPSDFQGGMPEMPRTNLALWITGSLWVSLAVPFTLVILIELYFSLSRLIEFGRNPPGEAMLLVLLGLGGALMSLAGISLLRGKLWARIYIGIAAIAFSVLCSHLMIFPFLSIPFRWGIVAFFGVLTVCTMLLSPWRRSLIKKQPQGG